MTVTSGDNEAVFTANGSTDTFSFSRIFYDESHIKVYLDGVLQSSGYTVSGVGTSSGYVQFTSPPSSGVTVLIQRVVPYTQETEFENFDGNPSDVTEKQFDLVVMQTQQLNEIYSRAVTVPVGDTSTDLELPDAATRAGGFVIFDGNGNIAVSKDSDTASAAAAAGSAAAAATSETNALAAQAAAEAAAVGIRWRPSVKAATTANITLSAPQTIDSVSCIAGDRVLVKDQSTSSQNGVYIVAAGSWTRAADADTWAELVSQAVSVEQGAANADSQWICTSDSGGTLGVTAVTWAPFLANPRPLSVTYGSINTSAIGTNADLIAGTASKLVDATTLENFLRPYDVTNSPTSGTTSLFTGIPTGVRRVRVTFQSLTHITSTARYAFTIGPVAGLETLSYDCIATFTTTATGTNSSTTDFLMINSLGVSSAVHGSFELILSEESTNTWVVSGGLTCPSNSATLQFGGRKGIAGALERIQFNLSAGAFSAGKIRVEAFYI